MQNPLDELQRRLEGKNISEVARRAGMARDNVRRIAKGREPEVYISTAMKLYKALDDMEGADAKA